MLKKSFLIATILMTLTACGQDTQPVEQAAAPARVLSPAEEARQQVVQGDPLLSNNLDDAQKGVAALKRLGNE